jgi:hypothetical protein
MVTLSGVIALAGFSTEIFSSADFAVVSQVLGDYVNGWDANSIAVVSTTLDARELTSVPDSSRKLSEFTFDLDFVVSFVAETTYGVDGRDFRAVQNLVDALEAKLDTELSSADFVSTVNSAGRLAGAVSLNQVRASELVSLELEGIVYTGVATMEASTLPAVSYDDAVSSEASSGFDYTTVSLFIGAVAVGFVAFVGILSHSMSTKYSRVSTDFPVGEVLPAEMDGSVSSPLNMGFSDSRSAVSASL